MTIEKSREMNIVNIFSDAYGLCTIFWGMPVYGERNCCTVTGYDQNLNWHLDLFCLRKPMSNCYHLLSKNSRNFCFEICWTLYELRRCFQIQKSWSFSENTWEQPLFWSRRRIENKNKINIIFVNFNFVEFTSTSCQCSISNDTHLNKYSTRRVDSANSSSSTWKFNQFSLFSFIDTIDCLIDWLI